MPSFALRVLTCSLITALLLGWQIGPSDAIAVPFWTIVPSPNGAGDSSLAAVTALGTNDAWAVGWYDPTASNQSQTLIEHWNETNWSIVSSPSPGQVSDLQALAAVDSNDVWAAGCTVPSSSFYGCQPLFEHWDGSSWSVVPIAPLTDEDASITSLAVISASNIWAAGIATGIGADYSNPLLLHWDGTSWHVVYDAHNALSVDASGLTSLSLVPGTDHIWGTGAAYDVAGQHSVTVYYDGTIWQAKGAPPVYDPYSSSVDKLNSVVALGESDVWSVGSQYSGTLAAHWNGSAWMPSNVASHTAVLNAVAAHSSTDLWAVGQDASYPSYVPYAQHWNGSTWIGSYLPRPTGASSSELDGVTAIPRSSDYWAVGSASIGGKKETLIEQYGADSSLTLSRYSGSPGQFAPIVATASAFTPSDTVEAHWNAPDGPLLGSNTVAGNGTVRISFSVPSAPAGTYTVYLVDPSNGSQLSAPFRIVPFLFLSPNTGAGGVNVQIHGTGFGANETVILYWADTGAVIGTASADGNGTVPDTSIGIPSGLSSGYHLIRAVGNTTGVIAKNAYRVP